MSNNGSKLALRIAIPSDGELYESTLGFLSACGVPVDRGNSRRYTGVLQSLEGAMVLFQRSSDIPSKVEDGSADIGIVGLDRFSESHVDDGDGFIIFEDLGYSRCSLVTAVPEDWVDITDMADVADLAVDFREKGRDLRVATKYPRLTQQFFFGRGVNYFTVVPSSGTLEAAPLMGFADLIVDISSTGSTLRENQLKPLTDGIVLRSQACLIGNRSTLKSADVKHAAIRLLIERIEAYLEGLNCFSITANVQGDSAGDVAKAILARLPLAGFKGPTVSQVYSSDRTNWFAATVVIPRTRLQEAVDHFRAVGGTGISVVQPRYVYHDISTAYQRLQNALSES